MTSEAERHFAFGENWRSFVELVDDRRIAEAEISIQRLLKVGRLDGKTFLDIGCGSGLFSLAARRLGATVHSFDFDEKSVESTRELKRRFFPGDDYGKWTIDAGSILDTRFISLISKFDVVFSWGVLHHTGNVERAILNAASLVAPRGALAISIYRRTYFCPAWKIEKRWYTSASPGMQRIARSAYKALFRLDSLIRRRDFKVYKADYHQSRGMDFEHDIHDWMGGYPYQSLTPAETAAIVASTSLMPETMPTGGVLRGLLGSGCAEYVFRAE